MNKVLFPIEKDFEAYSCQLKDKSYCLVVLIPESMEFESQKLITIYTNLCQLYPGDQILLIEEGGDSRRYFGHEVAAGELFEVLGQVKIMKRKQILKCLLPSAKLAIKVAS